jgi:hypothetical protein
MRFNNRFCALMDIPDLPNGAFEHIGDKRIKPQGGGGGIVSAITDPISSALGTDGGGGGLIGGIEDIGKGIGSGLADVDKFIGREIPGGWKTVGLAADAAAAPYAIGAMSAGAGTSAGGFVAADAAGMAASGLSEAAIAQNLAMAGVEATVAADAAALAASGLSEAAIAQNLTFAYGAELGATAANIAPTVAADVATSTAGSGVIETEAGKEAFFKALSEGATQTEAVNAGLSAQGGVPIYDYSQPSIVTPGGNVIPANTPPAQIAAIDAQIKTAGAEAVAKYGGKMSVGNALQLGMLGKGLLGGQPQQQQNPYQQQVARQQSPRGQVDYSGLLSLLQPKTAQRKTSLLG